MLQFWRQSLGEFLAWFDNKRGASRFFLGKLIIFFVVINFTCFWWALVTTYPQHLSNPIKAIEYKLMGFPVAFMGAAFDVFSLFVTVWIVRCALKASRTWVYLAYLSVDLVIAIVATFWVLFAFVSSGWLVNLVLQNPETFNQRTMLYEGRVWSAILNPFAPDNIKNMYFGVLMGASALLPTLTHLCMASVSAFRWGRKKFIYADVDKI